MFSAVSQGVAVDPALSGMVDNDGRDHDHSSAGEDLRAHHPRETDGEELTPHVRDGMYNPGPRAHPESTTSSIVVS
jgi:hypothetical protein